MSQEEEPSVKSNTNDEHSEPVKSPIMKGGTVDHEKDDSSDNASGPPLEQTSSDQHKSGQDHLGPVLECESCSFEKREQDFPFLDPGDAHSHSIKTCEECLQQ